MTEAELTGEVIKLCDELGLLWHHCPNSTRCQGPKGFPDLVIAGDNGLLVVELKSNDGETTAEQDLWRWTLARAIGPNAQIWRPENLMTGDIASILRMTK